MHDQQASLVTSVIGHIGHMLQHEIPLIVRRELLPMRLEKWRSSYGEFGPDFPEGLEIGKDGTAWNVRCLYNGLRGTAREVVIYIRRADGQRLDTFLEILKRWDHQLEDLMNDEDYGDEGYRARELEMVAIEAIAANNSSNVTGYPFPPTGEAQLHIDAAYPLDDPMDNRRYEVRVLVQNC